MLDDGSMADYTGDIQIYISGRATDSLAKNFITLNLKVTASASDVEKSTFKRLESQMIAIKPGESITFQSSSFDNLTSKGEYTVIKTDTSMKFITSSGLIITIAPQVRDIGTHTLQLFGVSDDGEKYIQVITIKVAFEKGSKDAQKYLEVSAKIIKVSRGGLTRI